MLKDTLVPLGYSIRELSGAEMMRTISRIVNPGDPPPEMRLSECGMLLPIRKRVFNSDFCSKDYYLTNGHCYFATLVMDTIPNAIPVGQVPGSCKRGFSHGNEHNPPVRGPVDHHRDLARQRLLANIFSGKRTAAAIENKEKITAIDDLLQDRAKQGWKLVKCFNSYLVWDKDVGKLQEKIQACVWPWPKRWTGQVFLPSG
jgi:hypothetical protein